MKNAPCDEKIFLIHWGAEYRYNPSEKQKHLAYFLIDNGATMIVGGHSHILGKYEKYQNAHIFYSLGNAIFDQEWGRKKCEPNMDCVFDENLGRETVPTYIGTAAQLDFPYLEPKFWQWNIEI